jgi:hypothetical protein
MSQARTHLTRLGAVALVTGTTHGTVVRPRTFTRPPA